MTTLLNELDDEDPWKLDLESPDRILEVLSDQDASKEVVDADRRLVMSRIG